MGNPEYKPKFKSEVNKFVNLLDWLQKIESYIDNLGSAVGSGDFRYIRNYLSWEEQYYFNIHPWIEKNKGLKFNVKDFDKLFKYAQEKINESNKIRQNMDPIEDEEEELKEDRNEINNNMETVAKTLKKINLELWKVRDKLGLNGIKFRKLMSENEILKRGIVGD